MGASVVHNGVRWTSGVMRCDTTRACRVQRAPGAVLCGSSLFGLRGACLLSSCVCSARTAAPRHCGTAAFCRDQITTAVVLTPCPPLNCKLNSSFTRCAGLLTVDPVIACNGAGLDLGQMLARPPRERAVGGQRGSRSGFCADSGRGASRSRRLSLSRTSSASSPTSTRQ